MKKRNILIRFIRIVVLFSFMVSCKKNSNSDATPPQITLKGANPLSISLNAAAWTDPGYSATDNVDGDVTNRVKVNNTGVNTNLKGNYSIIYTVIDAAGNTGTASRRAIVVNDADFLAGTYNVHDSSADDGSIAAYISVCSVSSTQDNALTINNFGNFGSVINVPGTYQSLAQFIFLAPGTSLGAGKTLGSTWANITNLSSPVNIVIEYYFTIGGNTYHHYATYTK